ncbi:MAG: FMN-binding protein, partial [Candidatus Omnitrophica bacterium]|nr:FMN-binding protein [Candidatus Omnitrophota bacterium]
MRKVILLLFFALGFFSLFSQTLIIREFIISFGGNELGISLFYFFWFFWVGIGALLVLTFLGKFLSKHFLKLLFFYPLLSFLEIILFINLRSLAGVPAWEFFTLERIFVYLFFLTSFTSLFTGIIFTQGVLWIKKIKEDSASSIISSSYIFEALGSFFSGCLITYLITKLSPPLVILTMGSLIFTFVAIVVSLSFKDKTHPLKVSGGSTCTRLCPLGYEGIPMDKTAIFLNSILFIILLIFSLNPKVLINFSQALRQENLFPQGKIIKEVYTPYQHILLGKLPDQTVVFSNGKILTSIPEEIDADKVAALFISQSNLPQSVIVFGSGAENLITSLLKFPIKSITYCLQDKIYYQAIYESLPVKLKTAIKERRLEVIFQSPRLFLGEFGKKFDLAVIYTSDPSNLTINTFFTKEFYSLVKENLTERGILASRLTSAENYIGQELKNYGSSLYYTLAEVFPKIVITPGEISWFFAAGKNSPLTEEASILEERFSKFVPTNFSFPPAGFSSLFPKKRVEFIKKMYIDNPLFKNGKLLNRDAQPLTFFLNLLVLARHSSSFLVRFFKNIFLAGLGIFFIPLIILFLARTHFLMRVESVKNKRLLFNAKLFQFLSGFLGFSFHLILIFLFQNKFGTIFLSLGLVNSLFMLGLCAGALAGKLFIKKFSSLKAILGVLIIQGLIILIAYPLFTQINLSMGICPPNTFEGGALSSGHNFCLFIIFFLVSGILTGSSYPLSAKVLQNNKITLLNTAVYLEFLDHWGGSGAGLITGLFMIPLLGIFNTLLILFSICFILIIFFVLEIIPPNFITRERIFKVSSFPYIRTSYILLAVSLIFIINFYLLERKKTIYQVPLQALEKKGCFRQESPFPAYVCEAKEGKTFTLESRNFAPGIRGFSGGINLAIKISPQGKIEEIKVIEHKESPFYVGGIDKFLAQFKGRFLKEKFSLGNNVEATSGATITSTAIIDIVNEAALKVEGKLKEKRALAPAKKAEQRINIGHSSVCLIFFTILAILIYMFFPHYLVLRRIYLFLVVIFLGFIFNLTFSFFHLANFLTFNLSIFKSPQMLIYSIPLVLGLLFGQFWCGWLCPFGALGEILGNTPLSRRVSPQIDKKARYFKYFFLAMFIIIVCIRRDANLFRQEPLSVFFLKPFEIFKDKILTIVILFFSLFFLRFWCRYFCICGAFFFLFNKIALFKKFFLKKYRN